MKLAQAFAYGDSNRFVIRNDGTLIWRYRQIKVFFKLKRKVFRRSDELGHCLASMIDHCLAFSEALALDEGNAKALFRRGTGEKATSTHAAVGPVHGQPGPKTIV